ncbi:MAG: putative acetyltransferase [Planctomycetota bacterium]|jgi:putative acetyltransferase
MARGQSFCWLHLGANVGKITPMHIREFRPTDLEAVVALFTASVRGLAADAYDDRQLQVWAPDPPDLEHWGRKIAGQNLLLADLEGELFGMVGYEDDGHVDVLFTHPAHARKGVAAQLHKEAERRLAEKGVHELFTESSEVARPFFERQGYEVERREVVEARGVELHRYRMRRRVTS